MSAFAQIDNDGRVRGTGVHLEGATGLYFGSSVLIGGTVTVNTTKALTGMRVFLQGDSVGIGAPGTGGVLTVTAVSDGVSFTITSSSITDARNVSWIILN